MKKLLLAVFVVSLLSSCSLFRKSEKRGCPSNGRNIGAERIASGDEKAIRASNKAKYKGGRKIY
jgi:hypothetical protein